MGWLWLGDEEVLLSRFNPLFLSLSLSLSRSLSLSLPFSLFLSLSLPSHSLSLSLSVSLSLYIYKYIYIYMLQGSGITAPHPPFPPCLHWHLHPTWENLWMMIWTHGPLETKTIEPDGFFSASYIYIYIYIYRNLILYLLIYLFDFYNNKK